MKKVLVLLAVVILLSSCTYLDIYHHFHPEELTGEAKVLKQEDNGDYIVTDGYVKQFFRLMLAEKSHDEAFPRSAYINARAMIFYYSVAQFCDGTWRVKPKMVEYVDESKK